MAFTQVSFEDIADEKDFSSVQEQTNNKTLNPQINMDFEADEKVVYYKNPKVHLLTVLVIGLPIIYFLISNFGSHKQAINQQEAAINPEIAKLQKQLDQLQKDKNALMKETAMRDQHNQGNVVTFKPKPKPKLKKVEPVVAKVAPVAPVAQPQAPQPQPTIQKEVVAEVEPEPEIDPMAKLQALSNRGAYMTTLTGKESESSEALAAKTSDQNQNKEYSLLSDKELEKRLNTPGKLYTREEIERGVETKLSRKSIALAKNHQSKRNLAQSQRNQKSQIEIGSSVKASLGHSVTWSLGERFNGGDKKYMLHLKEGWKDSSGKEILPEESRVIAQLTDRTSSGIFSMEVTEIITGNKKIPIPSGAIQVGGDNGSPLKAELKQKGSSNFARDLGSIVAPGVERAFDDLADSTETLILNDDGINSFSTTGTDGNSLLASGAAGVAEGANDLVNRRLTNNLSSNTASSYFQLDQGQEVLLTVYDNFEL